jgi:hypothetical protein
LAGPGFKEFFEAAEITYKSSALEFRNRHILEALDRIAKRSI